jgi:membrane protein YdbS with pleckstrin-like domain
MSNDSKTVNVSGLFTTLLLISFIVMKLAGVGVVSKWSWLWVLSPLWIPLAFAAVMVLIYIAVTVLRKKKVKETPKSKWQQRYEEMQISIEKSAKARQDN